MEPIVLSLILTFLGFLVLYFVVKGAVREGIKEAYTELKARPDSAGKTEVIPEKAEKQTEEQKEEAHG